MIAVRHQVPLRLKIILINAGLQLLHDFFDSALPRTDERSNNITSLTKWQFLVDGLSVANI